MLFGIAKNCLVRPSPLGKVAVVSDGEIKINPLSKKKNDLQKIWRMVLILPSGP